MTHQVGFSYAYKICFYQFPRSALGPFKQYILSKQGGGEGESKKAHENAKGDGVST